MGRSLSELKISVNMPASDIAGLPPGKLVCQLIKPPGAEKAVTIEKLLEFYVIFVQNISSQPSLKRVYE
jgi:hypothetical protein